MDPYEAMQKRAEAKRKIAEFFDEKRKRLKVSPLAPSADDQLKRDFLGRMNTLQNELEAKAMEIAEKGENVESVLKEAANEFEKLKKEFLEEIEDQPWKAKFTKVMQEIKQL